VKCKLFVADLAMKIHLSKDANDAVQAFPEFITVRHDDVCDEVLIHTFHRRVTETKSAIRFRFTVSCENDARRD